MKTVLLFIVFFTISILPATWYVNSAAVGNGTGTSMANAFVSLDSVKVWNGRLATGNTILIGNGTYTFDSSRAIGGVGTAANPLKIIGSGGTVIDLNGKNLFTASGTVSPYIETNFLSITNSHASTGGNYFSAASSSTTPSNLTFKNVTIFQQLSTTTASASFTSWGNNVTLINCTVYQTTTVIDTRNSGTNTVTAINCTFYNNKTGGYIFSPVAGTNHLILNNCIIKTVANADTPVRSGFTLNSTTVQGALVLYGASAIPDTTGFKFITGSSRIISNPLIEVAGAYPYFAFSFLRTSPFFSQDLGDPKLNAGIVFNPR